MTVGGQQCQPWDRQTPHAHAFSPIFYKAHVLQDDTGDVYGGIMELAEAQAAADVFTLDARLHPSVQKCRIPI